MWDLRYVRYGKLNHKYSWLKVTRRAIPIHFPKNKKTKCFTKICLKCLFSGCVLLLRIKMIALYMCINWKGRVVRMLDFFFISRVSVWMSPVIGRWRSGLQILLSTRCVCFVCVVYIYRDGSRTHKTIKIKYCITNQTFLSKLSWVLI